MNADMLDGVLAVVCVGLLLITASTVIAWRRALVAVDEAICDREFVWGVAWETAEQRDEARDDLASERERREQVEEDAFWLGFAFDAAREEHAANVALALTFYGRALGSAEGDS